MNSIIILSTLIALFLSAFLSLDQNNNYANQYVGANDVGKKEISYISVLSPEGKLLSTTTNPLPPVGEPVPVPNNPFSTAEGAPEIVLKYNNSLYNGELRSAVFEFGDVNDNMPSLEGDSPSITDIITDQIINITRGEQVQLLLNENPRPELQPNSLSSTLYHLNGTAPQILSLTEENNRDTFIVDADKGEYLLLAMATWLPNPDNYLLTSGYVSYLFRINVI